MKIKHLLSAILLFSVLIFKEFPIYSENPNKIDLDQIPPLVNKTDFEETLVSGGYMLPINYSCEITPEVREDSLNKIHYHTRHIPIEYLNLETPMGKDVQKNGLCDVLKEPYLQELKDYGIEVIETRLAWWGLEEKQGTKNYDRLKRDMDLIEKSGFKIGMFPWFQHPPKWENRITKLICLDHDVESTILSLWDEKLLAEYDSLYKDLSVKFGDRIKFLYVGVYGDYGEVQYPHGVEHYKFSPPHDHLGLWCGDSLARKNYKIYLADKYKHIKNLNKAWLTNFNSFEDDLMPKLPFEENSLSQRLDFMNWYSGSLLEFTDAVCEIARKYFPKTELGLPLGSVYEPIEMGQIKSLAAKIASKYGITARWTGLACLNEFPLSNVCARRVSSAARFYGCKFGLEASLILNKENVLNAVYETLSNGTYMLHNDVGNILRAKDEYVKYRNYIERLPVKCNISVYYPVEAEMCKCMDISSVYQEFKELRGYCDYEIADSYMIKDGFLETVKDLILPKNCLIPSETIQKIMDWTKKGGLVWYISGNEPHVLESGHILNIGTGINNWSHFGDNDGCFYTDHGGKVSKYDQAKQSIEITNK